MSTTRQFPSSPESVPAARHFVLGALSDLEADALDVISLLVSELATNSVQHARTDFEVDIDRIDGQVRVAVTDAGGGEPELQSPSTHDVHGRGLLLVQELANDWGVTPAADRRGKTVWFAFAISAHGDSPAMTG